MNGQTIAHYTILEKLGEGHHHLNDTVWLVNDLPNVDGEVRYGW